MVAVLFSGASVQSSPVRVLVHLSLPLLRYCTFVFINWLLTTRIQANCKVSYSKVMEGGGGWGVGTGCCVRDVEM